MPVRVGPVFSRGRQDGVKEKRGAGKVEHARYDDESFIFVFGQRHDRERHERVGEHDVAVEQENHVEHADERQCGVPTGEDSLVPASVALFPHQDHANAVAQEGGEHGQATDVNENGADHDGDFVPQ